MAAMDARGWPGLAEAVAQRRLELGLSIRAAADRAGVDRATWATIENGTSRLSRHRWSALERALLWEPGSVTAVVGGGAPTAMAGPPPSPARHIDLRAEYERARDQPVSWQTKFVIIGEVIDLYLEGVEAQQQAGQASRTA